MNTDKFEMVAKTFQGLEEVLAEELRQLGALNVEPGRRMVSFEGDKEMLYKANLHCRTALRILKPFYKFKAQTPEKLYDRVKEYDWSRLLTVDKTFVIETTVNSEVFTNSRFVTYKVKDAIVDWFRDHDPEGRRPGVRVTDGDVVLSVHISGTEVTIGLDSSGSSLHRRGWRVAQTEAPINEVLAAGIILKSGWRGDCPFIDPMCGSGTFLVEAALIAANIAPGIFRKGFAFEQWEDFDRELFERLYNDDSQEREITCQIIGADMSPKAIAIAQKNLKSAGVAKSVELELKPLSAWTEAPANGVLITNPPYGERLQPENIEGLYDLLGEKLKHVFMGYHVWIIGRWDEKQSYMSHIGLKASSKEAVFNGSLPCELREYIVFDGTHAEFKTAGGSTRSRRTDRPVNKHHHAEYSDRERYERYDRQERQEPAAMPENPLALRRNPKLLEKIGRKPKISARKSWRDNKED